MCAARWSVVALSVFLLGQEPWQFVRAAEFRSGEKVKIASGETIDDDLYVFGQEVVIEGNIDGDLLVWAQQVTIRGAVSGSVMAAGQTIVIDGQTGSARIAGQVLQVGSKAKLTGDLIAAGMSLECEKESEVTGDAIFAGYQALFAGKVGSDVRGAMDRCRVEGAIGGDVKLEVGGDKHGPSATTFGPAPPVPMPNLPGGLTVAASASIDGDLNYQSSQDAEIDPAARVAGEVRFDQRIYVEKEGQAAAVEKQNRVGAWIWSRLRHLISVALVGLFALLVFPKWTTAWADTIRQRPAASFLGGLIGLAAFLAFVVFIVILIILAAIFLFNIRITELGPLALVGGCVAYAAVIVGFWIVSAFLAEALAGLALGRMAVKQDGVGSRLGALAMGVALVGIVLSVPYLGGVIGFCIMILGLGSICLSLISRPRIQSFEPLPPAKPFPV
jgi:hypothetical protein